MKDFALHSPFDKCRQPMKAVGYLGKNLEPWSATFMPCKMLLCGESSEFYWTGWLLLHSWSPTFKFIERADYMPRHHHVPKQLMLVGRSCA